MLSGEPPFYDLDPTEALEAITEATDKEIRLKDSASQEARHFVEMCLKHDPSERYSASELLKVRLKGVGTTKQRLVTLYGKALH